MTFVSDMYEELLKEIDLIENRIQKLENEHVYWLKTCVNKKAHYVPLDFALNRTKEICDQVEIYSDLLRMKEQDKREMESKMSELNTIENKIIYLRDVKGLTLAEVAVELGYSYIWIRKLSSRIRRNRVQTVYRHLAK